MGGAIDILKTANIDYRKDLSGRTILSFVVSRQNEDLIDFILENKETSGEPLFLGDSLLIAIETRQYGITEKLIQYAEDKDLITADVEGTEPGKETKDPKPKTKIMKAESFGESFRFSEDILENPIIRACIVGYYPIINLFYKKGFRAIIREGECKNDPLRKLNAYRAYCSPGYLCRHLEDAMEVCFRVPQELEGLPLLHPVHADEYLELAAKLRQHAVSLLNECRNRKEVEQIMVKESEDAKEKETKKQKKGCWARITSALGVDTFPRLELAIKMEQKEFIAHPYFQKKVQEMYDPTETGCVKSLLTTLLQLLLSPFIAVYLSIFLKYDWSVRKRQVMKETKEETKEEKEKEKEKEKEEEGIMGRWQNQIKSPNFAAQRYFALYAVFVALLVTEAMKPTKNNKRNMTEFCRQIDAVEVLILIFVLGYLKHIGTLIHHNGWKFFHYIFNNLYLVTMGLFFSAYVVWGIGYWQVKHADLCDDPKLMSRRYQWNENNSHNSHGD